MSASRQASSPESNRSFYNRISRFYDDIADAGEHSARAAGEAALAVQPGEVVLEIGYGTGNSLVALGQSVGEQGAIEGLDISIGMRDVALHKVQEAGLEARVHLSIGDARELPYESATFDAAFLSFTLELFPLDQIPNVLNEIKRVLKPKGRLGVVSMATVGPDETESVLERTYIWMHQHFPHIVDCQPIDVEHFFRRAGFEISKRHRMEIFTMPVEAIVGVKA